MQEFLFSLAAFKPVVGMWDQLIPRYKQAGIFATTLRSWQRKPSNPRMQLRLSHLPRQLRDYRIISSTCGVYVCKTPYSDWAYSCPKSFPLDLQPGISYNLHAICDLPDTQEA